MLGISLSTLVITFWLLIKLPLRVERGLMSKAAAAACYLPTLLMPVILFYGAWALADFVNSLPGGDSIFNGDSALGLFIFPACVLGFVVVMNVVFLITLVLTQRKVQNI